MKFAQQPTTQHAKKENRFNELSMPSVHYISNILFSSSSSSNSCFWFPFPLPACHVYKNTKYSICLFQMDHSARNIHHIYTRNKKNQLKLEKLCFCQAYSLCGGDSGFRCLLKKNIKETGKWINNNLLCFLRPNRQFWYSN